MTKQGITLAITTTRNLCLRRQAEDWPRLEGTWTIQEPHRISSDGIHSAWGKGALDGANIRWDTAEENMTELEDTTIENFKT